MSVFIHTVFPGETYISIWEKYDTKCMYTLKGEKATPYTLATGQKLVVCTDATSLTFYSYILKSCDDLQAYVRDIRCLYTGKDGEPYTWETLDTKRIETIVFVYTTIGETWYVVDVQYKKPKKHCIVM